MDNIDAVITSATVAVVAVTLLAQNSTEPPKRKCKKTAKKASNKVEKTSEHLLTSSDFLKDILDTILAKKNVEKRKPAITHFNMYLGKRNKELLYDRNEIGITSFNDLSYDDVNTGPYSGEFAYYLASHVRVRMKSNEKLITYASPDGYLVAINNLLIDTSKSDEKGAPKQLQQDI